MTPLNHSLLSADRSISDEQMAAESVSMRHAAGIEYRFRMWRMPRI